MTDPEEDAPHSPRVLVVEDERVTREFVCGLLGRHGFDADEAGSAQDAIQHCREKEFDIVLLDVVMPGMGGLDCCRLLKSMSEPRFMPVILVTAKSDADSRVAGLRIGADDYICKPFDERELVARVTNLLGIKRMHDHVNSARERLARLAVEDELTGLYNYRYLQSRLQEEFKRSERYREPLSCIMLDIDHFKQVNDTLGHDVGDAVLKQTAERLTSAVREIDVVTRYGGEEFLLLLPSTNFFGSLVVAERVWSAVRNEPMQMGPAGEGKITVSVGGAVYPSRDIANKDELVKAADVALYEAKTRGRDRICAYQHQGYMYTPHPDAKE